MWDIDAVKQLKRIADALQWILFQGSVWLLLYGLEHLSRR
jgi:hypothetical protein